MAGIPVLLRLGPMSLYGEANDVKLDDIEPKMETNRQTLLDNCPSNKIVNKYSYIDIVYLPPNVTSVVSTNGCGNYCVVEAEI